MKEEENRNRLYKFNMTGDKDKEPEEGFGVNISENVNPTYTSVRVGVHPNYVPPEPPKPRDKNSLALMGGGFTKFNINPLTNNKKKGR